MSKKYIRVDNLTNKQIVEIYAKEFARKAEEAYRTYQEIGMQKFDNAYHKYNALAEALEQNSQEVELRQTIASYRYQLSRLAGLAESAMWPDAMHDSLRLVAKEVVAVAQAYNCYENKKGE